MILQAVQNYNIAGLGHTIRDVMADNKKVTMQFIRRFRHPQVKGGSTQRNQLALLLKPLFSTTPLNAANAQINFIKKHVFGIEDGSPIVAKNDKTLQDCQTVPKDESEFYVLFETGRDCKVTCMGDLSQPFQREIFDLIGNIIEKINDMTSDISH